MLQALDHHGILPSIDYLSTVSGGGYIGSCLSSYWAGSNSDTSPIPESKGSQKSFPFLHYPGKPENALFRHLRECASYLKPPSPFAGLRVPGLFLRGLLVNSIIVLPLLLLLAVTTVIYCKSTIHDAMNTTRFEYIIEDDELQEDRKTNGLKETDFQNVDINLTPFMSWDEQTTLDLLLSDLPTGSQISKPGSTNLSTIDKEPYFMNKIDFDDRDWLFSLPANTPFSLSLTAWESDSPFKKLNSNWGYRLRSFIPFMFDAWQSTIPAPEKIKSENSERDVYPVNLAEYIRWKQYVIVSGVPDYSESNQGIKISEGH